MRTKGVVAAMFPKVPIEKTIPERVAKLKGPNQTVSSFKVPMRLQAMPTPRRRRPISPVERESADEKIRAPVMPKRERPVIMRLGPTLSRKMLIGIWVMANA